MKYLIFLTSLLSFSAFAGDSYFICYTAGNHSYDVVNAYIGDGGVIEDSYYDIPDDYYTFEFNTETHVIKAVHADVHTGNLYNFVEATLEYYEPVKVSDKISCMLAD